MKKRDDLTIVKEIYELVKDIDCIMEEKRIKSKIFKGAMITGIVEKIKDKARELARN